MRKRTIAFSMIISLLFTSCAQKFVSTPDYDETITSFLMTKDTNTLAVIGNKYHYIFQINDNLKSFLLSDIRKESQVSFKSFFVDLNNTIAGGYSIHIPINKIEKQKTKQWLQEIGFQKNDYYKQYMLQGEIKGKRYLAKEIPSEYKFNKPYKLNIEEEPSKFRKTASTMLSPITYSADLAIGITVLGVFLVMHMVSSPFTGGFKG